jgi:mediator of RNA polymerase II transcription subunit 13
MPSPAVEDHLGAMPTPVPDNHHHPHHHHPVPQSETLLGNSLLANLILADSCMNVFRDHNFDSCNLCVCSEASDGVGNIRGLDGTLYLPDRALRHLSHDFGNAEASRCSCGFSAVVNRKKAYKSGLFFEDESEITGLRGEKPNFCCPPNCLSTYLASKGDDKLGKEVKSVLDEVPESLLKILRTHCLTLGCYSLSLFAKAALLRRERCVGRSLIASPVY